MLVVSLSPDNASRACNPDARWHNRSDYSQCKPLRDQVLLDIGPDGDDLGLGGGDGGGGSDYTFAIYLTGYSLSLVALLIACSAFLYFK